MEKEYRNLMDPIENNQEEPNGGLLEKVGGGLSRFIGDVSSGVNAVMSHPLYEHMWAGMVSGVAGDPMAGPYAVQQLKQMKQNQHLQKLDYLNQQAEMQRAEEMNQLRGRHIGYLKNQIKTGDRSKIAEAMANLDPIAAAKYAMEPAQTVSPRQVMGKNGRPVYVDAKDSIGMEPVPRSSPVSVNFGGDMRPDQQIAAEDRASSNVASETAKLRDALDAHRALMAVADGIRKSGRTPNQSETDSIVKMAARLENPEMVGEGDMARKAGGGFENFIRGRLGIGYVLGADQFESIIKTADAVAEQKRRRLQYITEEARRVAEGRGLNPNAIAPGSIQTTEQTSNTSPIPVRARPIQ